MSPDSPSLYLKTRVNDCVTGRYQNLVPQLLGERASQGRSPVPPLGEAVAHSHGSASACEGFS